jgi:hypothetical protein
MDARAFLTKYRDLVQAWLAPEERRALDDIEIDVPAGADAGPLVLAFQDEILRGLLPDALEAAGAPALRPYVEGLRGQAMGRGRQFDDLPDFELAGDGIFAAYCECHDAAEARVEACRGERTATCERSRAAVELGALVSHVFVVDTMQWPGLRPVGAAPAIPHAEMVSAFDRAIGAGLARARVVERAAAMLREMIAAGQAVPWEDAPPEVDRGLHAFAWGVRLWTENDAERAQIDGIDLEGSGRANGDAIASVLYDGLLGDVVALAWGRLPYTDARRVATDLARIDRLRDDDEAALPASIAERMGRVLGGEGTECGRERRFPQMYWCSEVEVITDAVIEASASDRALALLVRDVFERVQATGVARARLLSAARAVLNDAIAAGGEPSSS